MWKKHPDETGLDISLMKGLDFFAYRSRECINETALLLITDHRNRLTRAFTIRSRAVLNKAKNLTSLHTTLSMNVHAHSKMLNRFL